MGNLFLKILNMSIAAGWLILAVVLLRLALKRTPKWIIVLLWGIVALRLVVPFSFESALSLIPSAETFSAHNIQYEAPVINSGIPAVNNAVNPVLGEAFAPSPGGSVNPLYVWTFVMSVIWLIGIAAMLLYAVISYVRVSRSVAERAPYEGNIYLCDHVRSPFILGLFRPKIYLPSNMDGTAMEPVIAHEKAHLARHDHWWKPLGFLILTVHWFNPLCWAAFLLLCRDIELACDEKVIRQMDLEGKKQYSTALLECSTERRLVTICPLAFGEIGVKERVKNVLNYKKPAFWVIAGAVIVCAAVTVCFATDPKEDVPEEQHTSGIDVLRENYPEYFELGALKGLDGNSPGSAEGTDTPGTAGADTAATTLSAEQTAIRQAIMEHNRGKYAAGDFACESHIVMVSSESNGTVFYYVDVLYQEYGYAGAGFGEISTGRGPAVLSFAVSPDESYTLLDYWDTLNDDLDIRSRFPDPLPDGILDTGKNNLSLYQSCYRQAAEHGEVDTDYVTEQLLSTITSSPPTSFAPQDYMDAHPQEYQKLLYLGSYTLKYCFDRFEKGGETGLDGHIMMSACEDIAASWGESLILEVPAETGQEWYDAFKRNALRLMTQFSETELAEQYPASYLLLSMLGDEIISRIKANAAGIFDALDKLDYQPYTCDGLPEYRLTADDGTLYFINFTENWVWRGNSEQAELPAELIPQLKASLVSWP